MTAYLLVPLVVLAGCISATAPAVPCSVEVPVTATLPNGLSIQAGLDFYYSDCPSPTTLNRVFGEGAWHFIDGPSP